MENKPNKKVSDLLQQIQQIIKIESKKNEALKNLSISDFKKLCNCQEGLINQVLKNKADLKAADLKTAHLKATHLDPAVKDSSASPSLTLSEQLYQQSYANKEILMTFKHLADIYFKPFRNENYKKNGTEKNIPLQSFSIST